MTIREQFLERCIKGDGQNTDMVPRMLDLYRYGTQCVTVTEFGVRRGMSTCAFLAAGCRVTSYDIADQAYECPEDARKRWEFFKEDTTLHAMILMTDLLLIDSRHTAHQVSAELEQSHRVRKYILLHDVISHGSVGEDGQPGINQAIYEFLAKNGLIWRVKELLVDPNGILVLERIDML